MATPRTKRHCPRGAALLAVLSLIAMSCTSQSSAEQETQPPISEDAHLFSVNEGCPSAANEPPPDAINLGNGLVIFELPTTTGQPTQAAMQVSVGAWWSVVIPLPGVNNVQSFRDAELVDLNGDGQSEFTVFRGGINAHHRAIVQFDGCRLIPVVDDDTDTPDWETEPTSLPSDSWFALHVLQTGNGCGPTGCHIRIRCVGDELELSETSPTTMGPERLPEETEIGLLTERYAFLDGVMHLVDRTFSTHLGPAQLPASAPTADDSGAIDCPSQTIAQNQ